MNTFLQNNLPLLLQQLLQNQFFVTIVIPLLLGFFGALLEHHGRSVYGGSNGRRKFLVWTEEQVLGSSGNPNVTPTGTGSSTQTGAGSTTQLSAGSTTIVRPFPQYSIEEVLNPKTFPNGKIIELEILPTIEPAEFCTLGLHFVIAAFAVAITSLINYDKASQINPNAIGFVIGGLVILMITAVECVRITKSINPTNHRKKQIWGTFSICTGVGAMMLAFLAA